MGSKIAGIILLLIAIGLGLYVFGGVFAHGWDEGMIRLRHLDGTNTFFILGSGACATFGSACLVSHEAFLVAGVFLVIRRR